VGGSGRHLRALQINVTEKKSWKGGARPFRKAAKRIRLSVFEGGGGTYLYFRWFTFSPGGSWMEN